MGKKSCDFFGSKEGGVDVGSTKAVGLVVSRGSDKRVVVPKALCMGLKGVPVWEQVLKLVVLEIVINDPITASWCVRVAVSTGLSRICRLSWARSPHATHGLFGSLLPSVTCRGDSAAAAEWTQLTSTNNINAFVKITEHLYSIFARNINLASRYCDESLCERRIVSPKRNISKHVNHMRYNKN